MPSVRCRSERCQKVDKDKTSTLESFFCGVMAILLGYPIYNDRFSSNRISYGVVAMLVGFIAILCGVIQLATYDGPDRHVLQKVNLTLISKEQCSALNNKSTSQLKDGILDDTMFCAGSRHDNDICQGGGPLQLKLTDPYCMFSQIGVSSFGKVCGVLPVVNTRVSHYISWIESIVWP